MSQRRVLVDVRPLREFAAFRRLWLGGVASGFGSQLSAFAVTFYVWEHTRSPAMLGLAGLCTAVPLIAFALLGSAFADHVDRRRLVVGATWGQLAVSLLMAVVAFQEQPRVWAMLALAGAGSALSAVNAPARRALVAGMLPAGYLPAGLALNHVSFQFALLLGLVAAGAVTAAWGTGACFAVDVVSFLAALAGLRSLPRADGGVAGSRPGVRAAVEGIRFVGRTPAARGAFLADLAATVLAMPVALFPVINEERFGGSPQVLGLLTAALAAGGVLASVFSGAVTRMWPPGRVLLACVAVWGVALAGVGVSHELAVVLGLIAVAGAADTWAVVSRGAVVQGSTPDSHRGRVASLEFVVGAAGPQVGGVRAGLLAAGTSAGAALVIGGVACVAGAGLIAVLVPQLGRYRVERAESAGDVLAGTGKKLP
ncbi:MFS transporter [Longispora albida]|uniref:MFS transporter n=1 Tax=Longispora albida TaxID=203523 RepID=UPI00035F8B41|nr:MFS transporter [Longispora albida]